jgi:hypothetical protein
MPLRLTSNFAITAIDFDVIAMYQTPARRTLRPATCAIHDDNIERRQAIMFDNENFSDPEWVAEQLRLDWRERQFLTDAEACGDAEASPSARKGKIVSHTGGALSRFASEAALKHLQSEGWIKCHKVRKIDETFTPVRGWMRLWPLVELLKAEMVVTLADFADLPFVRLANLLEKIPGNSLTTEGEPQPLAHSLAEDWASRVLYWLGHDVGNTEERAIAASALDRDQDDRAKDPHLMLVDRRWLFGRNLFLPLHVEEPGELEDGSKPLPADGWLLLADVSSLRSARFEVEWLLDAYSPTRSAKRNEFTTFTDERWNTAQATRQEAAVSIDLNLVEPLRRFAHRNRVEEAQA